MLPDKTGKWLILAAGGRGERSGLAHNKAFESIAGACPIIRCLAAFSGFVEGAVVVIGADDLPLWEAVEPVARSIMPVISTVGRASRQGSVTSGLDALPQSARLVAVHDAARSEPSETQKVGKRFGGTCFKH